MNLRKWLAAAAVAAGTSLTGLAADPVAKLPEPSLLTFGTLQTMPEADAKAKCERWLNDVNCKFDRPAFAAVWVTDRSVTEKTLASIALGKPDARKLLDDARDITADAPTAVPAVIADETDPFVKANLGAAYARALAGKKVYEEALLAVKGVKAEDVVDPSSFLFFKAVAEHNLAGYQKAKKADAVGSLTRLLDDTSDTPDRYKMVATLMFFDLQNWSKDEKDLGNIGKLMDSSGRRLDLARGGQTTQDIQKRILFRLDEKIKDLENRDRGGPEGDGPPSDRRGERPNNPAPRSELPGGSSEGKVNAKELEAIAKLWGTLPDSERIKIAQRMVQEAPAKYKAYVEEYFKALQNSTK